MKDLCNKVRLFSSPVNCLNTLEPLQVMLTNAAPLSHSSAFRDQTSRHHQEDRPAVESIESRAEEGVFLFLSASFVLISPLLKTAEHSSTCASWWPKLGLCLLSLFRRPCSGTCRSSSWTSRSTSPSWLQPSSSSRLWRGSRGCPSGKPSERRG